MQMMIEYIILLGIVFIGWFILDLNKRLTKINASTFIKLENIHTSLQKVNAKEEQKDGES